MYGSIYVGRMSKISIKPKNTGDVQKGSRRGASPGPQWQESRAQPIELQRRSTEIGSEYRVSKACDYGSRLGSLRDFSRPSTIAVEYRKVKI